MTVNREPALRRLAARVCDARTMERFVDPLLADWRAEDLEAVQSGRVWHRRRLRAEYSLAFATVLLSAGTGRAMRTIVDRDHADHHAMRRAIRFSGIGVTIATVILILPFANQIGGGVALLYVVPQALPLAIPVGLLLGTLWGFGWSGVSRRVAAVMLTIALAASAASLVMLGWIVPEANQAFRAAVTGRAPQRGLQELTLGELRGMLTGTAAVDAFLLGSPRRRLEWTYYSRWALAFAPLALTVFALAVARRGRHSRWFLGVAGTAAIWGYYTLLWGARSIAGDAAMILAVWLPNVTLLLWSLAYVRRAGP